MNEDRLASGQKGDIGPPGKILPMEAIPVAQAVKEATDDHLGTCVPALDCLHYAATLFLGTGVHSLQSISQRGRPMP